MSNEITLAEVSNHRTKNSVWMVIHNNVYDVTKFLDEHPGGEDTLLEAAGQDSTQAFDDVGHSDDARELMKKYQVGVLAKSDQKSSDFWKRQYIQKDWANPAVTARGNPLTVRDIPQIITSELCSSTCPGAEFCRYKKRHEKSQKGGYNGGTGTIVTGERGRKSGVAGGIGGGVGGYFGKSSGVGGFTGSASGGRGPGLGGYRDGDERDGYSGGGRGPGGYRGGGRDPGGYRGGGRGPGVGYSAGRGPGSGYSSGGATGRGGYSNSGGGVPGGGYGGGRGPGSAGLLPGAAGSRSGSGGRSPESAGYTDGGANRPSSAGYKDGRTAGSGGGGGRGGKAGYKDDSGSYGGTGGGYGSGGRGYGGSIDGYRAGGGGYGGGIDGFGSGGGGYWAGGGYDGGREGYGGGRDGYGGGRDGYSGGMDSYGSGGAGRDGYGGGTMGGRGYDGRFGGGFDEYGDDEYGGYDEVGGDLYEVGEVDRVAGKKKGKLWNTYEYGSVLSKLPKSINQLIEEAMNKAMPLPHPKRVNRVDVPIELAGDPDVPVTLPFNYQRLFTWGGVAVLCALLLCKFAGKK